MTLSIGIVGLPNVGKSTLFEALTRHEVDRAAYPFATIEPNVGVVEVPDERVGKVAEAVGSKEKRYVTIEFVDIAGLIRGAHKGEGLGNQFLARVRETDALIFVLRAFHSPDVAYTGSRVHPIEDRDTLETELSLKDLETVEKRLDTVLKKLRAGRATELTKERAVLEKARASLEKGTPLVNAGLLKEEQETLAPFGLLTPKPRIFLLNSSHDEASRRVAAPFSEDGEEKAPCIAMNLLDELEAAELTIKERTELGLSGLGVLIEKTYELLDRITFFTANKNEAHAWQVRRGTSVREASGEVHSGFAERFIRAEVVEWEFLVRSGGWKAARERGKVRTEGREYIVKEGDVIEVKHGT